MTIIKLAVALFVPFMLGLGFLRLVNADRRRGWLLRMPCAFGLGCGFLTLWMLFLIILGLKHSPMSLHLPLLTLGGLYYTAGYRRHGARLKLRETEDPASNDCRESG